MNTSLSVLLERKGSSVFSVPSTITAAAAVQEMNRHKIGAVLVMDGDRLVASAGFGRGDPAGRVGILNRIRVAIVCWRSAVGSRVGGRFTVNRRAASLRLAVSAVRRRGDRYGIHGRRVATPKLLPAE